MDTKILRLLIVDESPDEAELALTALRKGGYLLKPQRVNDLPSLQAALEKGTWDAIIAERTLPHFGINVLLDTLKQTHVHAPVLILTRAIPDAEIATVMRAGARDVILKNQMARLLPALERELAVAAERAQYRALSQNLEEIRDKHRAVVEGAREAVCYSHDGMHIDANKAYLDMFEYENTADLEGVPIMNLIDKNEHTRFKQFIRKGATQAGGAQEFVAIRKSGTRFPVELTLSSVTINGEACTQILVTDVSQRKAVETKLQFLNQHDPLTGLYNRQHFLHELAQSIERAKREGKKQSLMHIDFADLRQVTQTLGHAAYDRFLLDATRKLRELFGQQAFIARYGDHEFTALVEETPPAQLRDFADRIEKIFATEGPVSESGTPIKCACRVAAASIDATTESAQKLMAGLYPVTAAPKPAPAAAETAAAKPAAAAPGHSWRGTPPPTRMSAVNPAPSIGKPIAPSAEPKGAPKDWQERIKFALERDGFRLIYQPIVNLHGEAAEYFEVLVRLVGDDEKLIPAAHFMPHAEKLGQTVAIDRWVVRQSIRALAELHRQQRKVRFFINLSPSALKDVELVVIAQQVLHETGLKGKYIIFELDEAAITTDADHAMAFMRAAGKIGCSFCIDNFGRALAATNRLREPMVQYLKLDGTLTQNLHTDPVSQASMKAVVEVAKAMEKKTIAKSVESADALSALWTLGVDYVQGHYFQEADTELNYDFGIETTISSSEGSPQWAVAGPTKSH